MAFERILNTPKRGIGLSTLQQIHGLARLENISLPKAARRLSETESLRPSTRTALVKFFQNLDTWRGLLHNTPHSEVVKIMLEDSGYIAFWQADKSVEAPGRLENLKELVGAVEEFDSLQSFLEHVSLVMDATNRSQEEMISLMTLHAAKGLEFETVFFNRVGGRNFPPSSNFRGKWHRRSGGGTPPSLCGYYPG